jgi:hypothetical protein
MTKAVPARVVELLLIFATILSKRQAAPSKAFDLRHSGFVIPSSLVIKCHNIVKSQKCHNIGESDKKRTAQGQRKEPVGRLELALSNAKLA